MLLFTFIFLSFKLITLVSALYLLFDSTSELNKMEYFEVLVVWVFFFLIRTSHGNPIVPELQHYVSGELRKLEEAYDNKLKELREEIRNENVLLKRENSLLKVKLFKERQRSFREFSGLRNESKVAEKRFVEELRTYKDQVLNMLQEKNRKKYIL